MRPTANGLIAETANVLISVGGQEIRGVDFGVDGRDRDEGGRDRRDRHHRDAPHDLAFESDSGSEIDKVIEQLANDQINQGRKRRR